MNTVDKDQNRNLMWCSLIKNYALMSKSQKKKFKLEYAIRQGIRPHMITECNGVISTSTACCIPSNSLGNLTFLSEKMEQYANCPKQEEEQENKMDIMQAISTGDNEKRRHLYNRWYSIREEKSTQLKRTFGLLDEASPTTFVEAMERVKAGRYVLPEKYQDPNNYHWSNQVKWRDPAVKEDRVSYYKAYDLLAKEGVPVEDAIAIKTPEEALVALQTWEAAPLPTIQ